MDDTTVKWLDEAAQQIIEADVTIEQIDAILTQTDKMEAANLRGLAALAEFRRIVEARRKEIPSV